VQLAKTESVNQGVEGRGSKQAGWGQRHFERKDNTIYSEDDYTAHAERLVARYVANNQTGRSIEQTEIGEAIQFLLSREVIARSRKRRIYKRGLRRGSPYRPIREKQLSESPRHEERDTTHKGKRCGGYR